MKRFAFLVSMMILLSFLKVNGQNQELHAYDKNIIPPSPEASSLGKYGDVPVSLYTGTVQLNIPFYEVEEKGYKLPISLSYHPSGIKVDDIAPWVGLGWALNAGGVISRSVRGLPDEKPYGFLNSPELPSPVTASNVVNYFNVGKGLRDSEPDIFYFNFGGKSGKFVLSKNNSQQEEIEVQYTIPYQKIKIKWLVDKTWKAITEDGTTYQFEQKEIQQSTRYINGDQYGNTETDVVSAWYLTKIILPGFQYDAQNSRNPGVISLEYGQESSFSRYLTAESQTKYHPLNSEGDCNGAVSNSTSYMQIQYQAIHLSTISWSSGTAHFIKGAERKDLPHDYLLEKIEIKNSEGELVKNYLLEYNNTDRLYLTSIKEISKNNNEINPPYQFDYFPGLISRPSFAQDYWGYFNGEISNKSLSPPIVFFNEQTNQNIIRYDAQRGPSLEDCRRGSLQKVTYPTGGSTTFEYELHDFSTGKRNEVINFEDGMGGRLDIFKPDEQAPEQVTYGDPFIVNDYRGAVQAKVTFTRDVSEIRGFEFQIWRFEGDVPVEQFGRTYYEPSNYESDPTVRLINGTYKIKHITGNAYNYDEEQDPYGFVLGWEEYKDENQNLVGGLRIKKIIDYDPETTRSQIKTYKYKKGDTEISSGGALNTHGFSHEHKELVSLGRGHSCTNLYLVVSSNSQQPLGSTQGGNIGYSEVTVYNGDIFTENAPINGKTTYFYTSPEKFPDLIYFTHHVSNTNLDEVPYPFAPVDCMDWKRGLLERETHFKKTSGGYVPIKETINNYIHHEKSKLSGIKVGLRNSTVSQGNWSENEAEIANYKITSGYSELQNTTEVLYDETFHDKTLKNTINFKFSRNHLQLLEKSYSKSDGTLIIEKFKYPEDLDAVLSDEENTATALASLVASHQLNKIVEHNVLQLDPSSGARKLISGELVLFKHFNQIVRPYQVLQFRTDEPTEWADTKIEGGALIYDQYSPKTSDRVGYEVVATFDQYDDEGNILQVKKQDGIDRTYLWAYNNLLPIAEVRGANANEVFHTSFEEDGIVGMAKTGKKYKQGGFTFIPPASFSPSPNSVITYFYHDQEKWVFKKLPYNGGNIRLEEDAIDEVRIFPLAAQITTFTYDPLIGLTSSTDTNGYSTYYEFDLFNRLKLVRDDDKKIVKSYKYNYKH